MTETTDFQRLMVSLEANVKKYEKELARATGIANKQARKIERRFDLMNSGIVSSFRRTALNIAGAFGVGFGISAFVRQVQGAISELARISNVAQRVGVTTDEFQALRFELAQNGSSAEEADRAMERFGDSIAKAALGSGFLADVLKANNVSLRDQNGNLRSAGELLQEYARLVAGAGSAQEKLLLASEAFGRRRGPQMIATLERINSEGLGAIVQGAKDAGVVVDQELVHRARQFDDAWDHATKRVKANFASFVVEAVDLLSRLDTASQSWLDDIEGHSVWESVPESIRGWFRALGLAARAARDIAGGHGIGGGEGSGLLPGDDIAPFPSVGSGGQTRIPSKGGGSGSVNQFERQNAALEKRIALLNAEAAAIGKGTLEAAKAEARTRLLNAAKQAGIAPTDELTAKVEALAQRYGEAALKVEQAHDKFEALQEVSREFGDALSGAFKDMVLEGRKFDEVLQSLLKRLASFAIDSFFRSLFGGAGGIFGSLFGGGRAAGGPVQTGRPYVVGERGPEIVVPGQAGMVVPNHALGRAGMGGPQITYAPTYHVAQGADPRAIVELRRAQEQDRRQFRTSVVSLMREGELRGVRA